MNSTEQDRPRDQRPFLLEEAAQLRRLEFASTIEASTLLLLVGVAVPLKHVFGIPAGVATLGPVHGVAFLFYIWTVIQTVFDGGWHPSDVLRLAVAAVVPFAGFFNATWIRRRRRALENQARAG